MAQKKIRAFSKSNKKDRGTLTFRLGSVKKRGQSEKTTPVRTPASYKMALPPGFTLGVADSATQYRGGDYNHTWNNWYRSGYIADGSNPADMDGNVKWAADLALMRDMGIRDYRFSVEWAMIEPSEGVFDGEALTRIRGEIVLMLTYGIRPLVTLHHFTNPMWFEERGGWELPENTSFFLRYVEKVVRAIGHLASDYITINEPNVYATNGYHAGIWPPGKKSLQAATQVMSVMASAHIKSYKLIHDIRRRLGFSDTRVSAALHLRVFEPKMPWNPVHRKAAATVNKLFQTAFARAVILGEFQRPLKNLSKARRDTYCDFHAVNYYTRSSISGLRDGARKNVPKNDLGWEIYPQGLIRCASMLHDIKPLPIIVTENGTCDTADSFRSLYIFDHLSKISGSTLPFERYYHWCFTDNFEWSEGLSARFGLVAADIKTGEREVKQSGRFYSEIIENSGVTNDMYLKYIKGQKYHH